MTPTEAIKRAKELVAEYFADDHVSQIGLEEIDFDERDKVWNVTIGFYRPLAPPQSPTGSSIAISAIIAAGMRGDMKDHERIYKVVSIRDKNGELISIRNRYIAQAA